MPKEPNPYDQLLDKSAPEPDEIFIAELDGRQQEVFAPFNPPVSHEPAVQDYDKLFDPERDDDRSTEDAAARTGSAHGRAPTEASIETAVKRIAGGIDPNIREIVRFTSSGIRKPEEVVSAIREDPTVRQAVAGYLIGKISKSYNMPERILSDSQKKTKVPGYYSGFISSREYSTLLALAMIDGSYKDKDAENDQILLDSRGIAVLGQHRWAAAKILEP